MTHPNALLGQLGQLRSSAYQVRIGQQAVERTHFDTGWISMTEDEYLDAQKQLFQNIAITLIQYTPETWNYMELLLQPVVDQDGNETLTHIVSNPKLNNDSIMAPEELYDFTYTLLELSKAYGKAFKSARLKIYDTAGKWKLASDFQY